jgi:hypothetical protein
MFILPKVYKLTVEAKAIMEPPMMANIMSLVLNYTICYMKRTNIYEYADIKLLIREL